MSLPSQGEIRPNSAANTRGNRPTAAQYVRAAELALDHFPNNDGTVLMPIWRLAEIISQALAEGVASVAQQPTASGFVPVGTTAKGAAMTKPTFATPAAIPFDFSSPAVRQLPELLEVHRLAEYVHASLIELGDDLPLALSGWVTQEASAYLAEARAALWHCAAVVAKGAQYHAYDREAGQ